MLGCKTRTNHLIRSPENTTHDNHTSTARSKKYVRQLGPHMAPALSTSTMVNWRFSSAAATRAARKSA